ncbi:Uu.00g039050.m01.CDS01 [Anthostomella pinea]|uniref:Uu.00g039050.m01.CDS01 n=1 Tax=Anthostomella pinea TaxID=933095 RepID=A0AAI8VAF3_9PEZI|nr:Uu.00g039050.m01.CDS01 [Anthostomella pinea]
MAHIILTGATGQAGSAVLAYALSSPAVSRVSLLSRRPVKLAESSPKANVIIHSDFSSYPEAILDQLRGATACIWAQGISSQGMSEDEYTRITLDYPVAAAKAFAGLAERMNFVYFSGEGGDMEEKASTMFGRIKGRAESRLLALQKDGEYPSLRVYNIRPAIINPQGNYLAERSVTLHDRASTWVGGLASVVWKSFVIPSDKLAKACTDLAVGDGEAVPAGEGVEADGRLLRNTALRRLAGL